MKKLMMTAAVVAMFFATANTNAQTEKVQKTPEKVHGNCTGWISGDRGQ